jgi:hypothetical protein
VPGGTATARFDLVRNLQGRAPLVSLATNQDLITAIAQVTFYGQDHAGNDVSHRNIGIVRELRRPD